jgi:uncharacterized OB-fold protein
MTTAESVATVLPEDVLPRPVPSPDGLDEPFWTGATRHVLVVQKCRSCHRYQWAPEFICHRCLSDDIEWVEVEASGNIYSWERVWHPVPAGLAPVCPYQIVLVELPHADGIRLLGNLVGDKDDCKIGAPVTAVFEDHGSGDDRFTLINWQRA